MRVSIQSIDNLKVQIRYYSNIPPIWMSIISLLLVKSLPLHSCRQETEKLEPSLSARTGVNLSPNKVLTLK